MSVASKRRRRGFTLIELAIAISILMIGMVSVVSATSRMHHLRRQNRERAIAQNAVRSVAERIHARAYEFSSDIDTWSQNLLGVFGPGGSYGDTFDVEGLNVDRGQAVVGTIQIVTDETATDQALSAELGLPRDLNGDGAASSTNVSSDARILPVILRLQWRSQSGTSVFEHSFYVTGY